MAKVLYKSNEVENVSKLEFVEISRPVFEKLEIKRKAAEVYDIETEIVKLRTELENLKKERINLEGELSRKQESLKVEIEVETDRILEEAKTNSDRIIEVANAKAVSIEKEAEARKENIEKESNAAIETIIKEHEKKLNEKLKFDLEKGRQEGYDDGFKHGEEDSNKVIEKLQSMISSIISKRREIIESSSDQIINLVMQIAVKVVKKITDTQKGIVIDNVKDALRKIKDKSKITVHVNLDDIDIVNNKKAEFISRFDNIEGLEVLEDSSVAKGGCIIETDFGEIDARISSQLDRIEEKVKNFSPIA